MPAAAPAASSVLRSLAVTLSSWPTSEPSAPPVAMMGPSAPNGPPVPMATAADSGLRNVIARRDAALVEEHLLHRLGDAVAADGPGAVARHEPHDERAHHGNDDDPRPRCVVRRASRRRREAAEEGEVGDEVDEPREQLGHDARRDGQEDGHAADEHDAAIHGLQDRGGAHALQRGPHRGRDGEHLVGDALTYLGDLRFLHGASFPASGLRGRPRLRRRGWGPARRHRSPGPAPRVPRASAPRSAGCHPPAARR